jgi:CheY-like chemotaxis protein
MASEPEPTTEKGPPQKPHAKKSRSAYVVPQIADMLKITVWIIVLVFIFFHWGYFSDWFRDTTHLELPGVKLDRYVQASAKIEEYASSSQAKKNGFDPLFAQSTIVRAQRVAPALRGALVLWADDHPENNEQVQKILEDLGMRFVTAKSTDEALQRLERDSYDLIISSSRHNEQAAPLTLCPVHYFDFPDSDTRARFNDNLDAFNDAINKAAPGGFVFMEKLKDLEVNHGAKAIPIIFYSASTRGLVRSLCARTTTNRADILLQNVVSSLEEQRWQELSDNTRAPRGSLANPRRCNDRELRAGADKRDYHAIGLEFLRRVVCEWDLKSIIDRFSEVLPTSDVPTSGPKVLCFEDVLFY